MAALSDRPAQMVVDLREVAAAHLAPLLEEEVASWRTELNWDFRPAAALVERFVRLRALNGYALLSGGRVAGYSYYVIEESKGLIGDFYLRHHERSVENENQLLEATLDGLWRTPEIRRVEAQLLMLCSPFHRPVPHPQWFRSYPRLFVELRLPVVPPLAPRVQSSIAIAPWSEDHYEVAAKLIAASYQGHIDSQINDQYRSAVGARRFLTNIVQYPGCGAFFGPASFVAAERGRAGLSGLSLASLVAAQTGHITQICVEPGHLGTGLGYELLRRSIAALAAHGCQSVSLTVTTANDPARRFYAKIGFRSIRDFAAYVWERS